MLNQNKIGNDSRWPWIMRAETAAEYCDDKSVGAFKKSVGTLYPLPHRIPGKGYRWLRKELDLSLDSLLDVKAVNDAAEVL